MPRLLLRLCCKHCFFEWDIYYRLQQKCPSSFVGSHHLWSVSTGQDSLVFAEDVNGAGTLLYCVPQTVRVQEKHHPLPPCWYLGGICRKLWSASVRVHARKIKQSIIVFHTLLPLHPHMHTFLSLQSHMHCRAHRPAR